MLKSFKLIRRKRRRIWGLLLLIVVIMLFIIAAIFKFFVGRAEWAGITVSDMSQNLAMEFRIPADEEGVVVQYTEGPAYYSGVKEGDLIKSINNQPVRNVREFLKVARTVALSDGVLLDVLREGRPLYITMSNRGGPHGMFASRAWEVTAWGQNGGMTGVAFAQTVGRLPSPAEQRASQKELVEGHWLGMEVIPLVPELAKEFGISPDTQGLLVDEISLESAEAGVLAGDMILAVDGVSTPDLQAFTEATRRVQNRKKAALLISRKGQLVKLTIESQRTLGFSQNETAQPIPPGAISPHRNRNKPCTACHVIMESGGQLPIDAGDILPSPPPITKGAVSPHGRRGTCKSCHVILK